MLDCRILPYRFTGMFTHHLPELWWLIAYEKIHFPKEYMNLFLRKYYETVNSSFYYLTFATQCIENRCGNNGRQFASIAPC